MREGGADGNVLLHKCCMNVHYVKLIWQEFGKKRGKNQEKILNIGNKLFSLDVVFSKPQGLCSKMGIYDNLRRA